MAAAPLARGSSSVCFICSVVFFSRFFFKGILEQNLQIISAAIKDTVNENFFSDHMVKYQIFSADQKTLLTIGI